MNGLLKQYSLWIVVILVVILALSQLTEMQSPRRTLAEPDFIRELNNDNLKSVEAKEVGKNLIQVNAVFKTKVDGQDSMSFKTNEFRDEWKTALQTFKVDYRFNVDNTVWQDLLVSVLPVVLILGLFWFFMFRQMQGGNSKAMSFGKSRARMISQGDKTVTFNDVAGVDEAKEELQEIIEFLKDPKRFTHLGGKIPRGVLLVGSPGSGKTLLARAVAGEANVPFFSISGSDFVEMFVGVGASRVRDLFQQGHKNAPCIIFIDEIDAVGRQRGAGLGGGHDEREQTLNQLLVEMDGFNTNDGVILMAATNRPDVLDQALLRPGRFDRQIVVPNPDINGRKAILEIHVNNQKVPLSPDVDLAVMARGTPGFSGADLANMVNEAALLAARRGQDKVTMIDFEDAKDRVLMGPARRSLVMGAKEKESTAYHEAGHTLVARLLSDADPVHKVTIIPRGRALGITSSLPIEDRYSISKTYCLASIRVLMGGRAAEDIVFGQFNSGASSDLKRSTQLAHKMVCEWGMSELGPITFGGDDEVFIGRDFTKMRDFSEETASAVDREIHRICEEAYRDAKALLERNLPVLKALAEALVERETLEAREIDSIISEVGGPDLLPPRPTPDVKRPPLLTPELSVPKETKPAQPVSDAPEMAPDGAVPETA
ncbi:MAG: ATP-dependent metallopeptidase FtsH/Yme1/Tma family protein [Candidatus Hydrogenedentes bacterium]|nr:ATP-dependent metallopeptidase FtsH/Yme1/Tma family protein [Candidatus Hydrogenedentota bacterium]